MCSSFILLLTKNATLLTSNSLIKSFDSIFPTIFPRLNLAISDNPQCATTEPPLYFSHWEKTNNVFIYKPSVDRENVWTRVCSTQIHLAVQISKFAVRLDNVDLMMDAVDVQMATSVNLFKNYDNLVDVCISQPGSGIASSIEIEPRIIVKYRFNNQVSSSGKTRKMFIIDEIHVSETQIVRSLRRLVFDTIFSTILKVNNRLLIYGAINFVVLYILATFYLTLMFCAVIINADVGSKLVSFLDKCEECQDDNQPIQPAAAILPSPPTAGRKVDKINTDADKHESSEDDNGNSPATPPNETEEMLPFEFELNMEILKSCTRSSNNDLPDDEPELTPRATRIETISFVEFTNVTQIDDILEKDDPILTTSPQLEMEPLENIDLPDPDELKFHFVKPSFIDQVKEFADDSFEEVTWPNPIKKPPIIPDVTSSVLNTVETYTVIIPETRRPDSQNTDDISAETNINEEIAVSPSTSSSSVHPKSILKSVSSFDSDVVKFNGEASSSRRVSFAMEENVKSFTIVSVDEASISDSMVSTSSEDSSVLERERYERFHGGGFCESGRGHFTGIDRAFRFPNSPS